MQVRKTVEPLLLDHLDDIFEMQPTTCSKKFFLVFVFHDLTMDMQAFLPCFFYTWGFLTRRFQKSGQKIFSSTFWIPKLIF